MCIAGRAGERAGKVGRKDMGAAVDAWMWAWVRVLAFLAWACLEEDEGDGG